MADANKKKRWSYIAGRRGVNWVRAYEEAKTGILYLEWYEEAAGERPRRKRKSLGHRDTTDAKDKADKLAAAFLDAEAARPQDAEQDVTVHQLIDNYLRQETPHKGESKQGHDHRTAALFKEFLPANLRAENLNKGHWVGFIRARRSHEIAPPQTLKKIENKRKRGEAVEPLGDRQIAYDLKFLWSVLNWAVEGDEEGTQHLERNPLRGVIKNRDWPREENPSRPRLTDEQFGRMLAVAADMDWRFEVALILAHETGHRIGSIRKLKWGDSIALDLVSWRKENDKIGMEHETPITHPAIGALQRAKEENPEGEWIFPHPHPDHEGAPCSRHVMRTWWDEAQEKAGLGHVERLGWHALRRKFANDLRHVPLKDLAQLGGWKDVTTILTCYLGEDMDAMRDALGSRRGRFGDPTRADGGRRRQSA